MAAVDALTLDRMRTALEAVSRRIRPVAAYLFGSRIEGRADEWSDYNLAVFLEGVEHWDRVKLACFCAEIQKEAGDDIELHVFSAAQANSPETASFAEWIIQNGIELPVEELAA